MPAKRKIKEGEEHFLIPKRQKPGRVDKTALVFGEELRIEDNAYRQSARGRPCRVPNCAEDQTTVVLCHIRFYNAGIALKPSDDKCLFLCGKHHDEFDGRQREGLRQGAEWVLSNIVIPEAEAAYRNWKEERLMKGVA